MLDFSDLEGACVSKQRYRLVLSYMPGKREKGDVQRPVWTTLPTDLA